MGVGALAGSTIMLLTVTKRQIVKGSSQLVRLFWWFQVPWFLSIFGGRVDIVEGRAAYAKAGGTPIYSTMP